MTRQVYGELQRQERPLDYCTSAAQWWECQFVGEGIIDQVVRTGTDVDSAHATQGGGFRECVTEMAEELCPGVDQVAELPYFLPTPNRRNAMGADRDGMLLNPHCIDYKGYFWVCVCVACAIIDDCLWQLGQLVGAAFRSKQFVPLALSPFVWKGLLGEVVGAVACWNVD